MHHGRCEAMFSNSGTSSLDHYFAFVPALQFIFIRNYMYNQTVRKVTLEYFPTCLQFMERAAVTSLYLDLGVKYEKGQTGMICAVGTKCGKVLLYKMDLSEEKLLAKTKDGVFYGGVTALSVQSSNFIAANSSGEVALFSIVDGLSGITEI